MIPRLSWDWQGSEFVDDVIEQRQHEIAEEHGYEIEDHKPDHLRSSEELKTVSQTAEVGREHLQAWARVCSVSSIPLASELSLVFVCLH